MLAVVCFTISVVIVLAWLADAKARRAAWHNIALARRASASERAERAVGAEPCPYCHSAVPYTD
jgi:hypothetical protein